MLHMVCALGGDMSPVYKSCVYTKNILIRQTKLVDGMFVDATIDVRVDGRLSIIL